MNIKNMDFIVRILDKIVDSNISMGQVLAEINIRQGDQKENIEEILDIVKYKLKEDIKNEIVKEMKSLNLNLSDMKKDYIIMQEEIEEHRIRTENIDNFINDIKKKGFYLKYIATILAAVATIAGAYITMNRSILGSSSPEKVEQKSENYKNKYNNE